MIKNPIYARLNSWLAGELTEGKNWIFKSFWKASRLMLRERLFHRTDTVVGKVMGQGPIRCHYFTERTLPDPDGTNRYN